MAHGKDEVDLPSEETAEPSRHGDDDGVRHEIGGHGPRGLIDARGQASPDMVEGDVDDRGVDDLEKGGKHHGERYEPLVHVFHDKPCRRRRFSLCDDRRDNGETHPQEHGRGPSPDRARSLPVPAGPP